MESAVLFFALIARSSSLGGSSDPVVDPSMASWSQLSAIPTAGGVGFCESGCAAIAGIASGIDRLALTGGASTDGSLSSSVWRSEDGGATWTLRQAASTWEARQGFGFFAVAGTNSISGTAIKEGRLFLIGGETAGSTKNDGESRSTRLCRRQEVHFPPLTTHFPSLTSHLSQCTRPTITVPPSCVAPTAHRGTPAQILGRPWSSHPDA